MIICIHVGFLLHFQLYEKINDPEHNNTTPSSILLGLKKFLAGYPALFFISGDYVHVNTYQIADDSEATYTGAGGKRDYIQEAKDYFKHKLLMYGIGTEVPIRSLMGHRSQASPQVRHISGQHFKEFSDFLMKHTDYFKVVEDHVVLVDVDDQDVPASDRLHLPQASIDTKATQQLLDFFAQCIENKGEWGIASEMLFSI